MLAFPGVLVDLHGLRFGDVAGKQSAYCPPLGMDGQHDLGRQLAVQIEERFEHFDDEIHRRVVIVEQNHLVHRWRLQDRLGFLNRQTSAIVLVGLRAILIEC